MIIAINNHDMFRFFFCSDAFARAQIQVSGRGAASGDGKSTMIVEKPSAQVGEDGNPQLSAQEDGEPSNAMFADYDD